MSSVEGEERFDSFFMKVAEEARGIDNLMDYFFSFLERKTDFFTGVQDSKMAEQTVMKAFHKHQKRAIKRREDEKRRHAAEDEERRKKLAAQREKDKAEYEKLQAERRKQQEDLSKRPKIEEITEEEDHQQDHPMKDRQPTTNGAHAAAGKDQPSSSSSASQAANGTTEDKEIKDKAEEVVIGEDDDEADDGAPNPAKYGNGGKTDRYTWTQTLGTVEVLIPVPPGTKSSQLSVVMTADRLKVGLKGQTPIVDGKLHQKIKPDDCMWTLVDNKLVQINIDKYDAMRWWSCVLVGDPEINTRKIVPENSKLSDLDGETRMTVEKMMFDQRQKAAGLPTSDQLKQHDLLEKFKAAHPEMDFSNAKINYGGGGGMFA